MDLFAARGRLPDIDELPETADVISALGTLKRAFRLIQNATGAEAWPEIAAKRAQDLLIYLALARFNRRPTLHQLPLTLQRDVKALFPSYGQACNQADTLLFSVGKTEEVNAACSAAPIGKKTPEAPYVHRVRSSEGTVLLYESRRRVRVRRQSVRAECDCGDGRRPLSRCHFDRTTGFWRQPA